MIKRRKKHLGEKIVYQPSLEETIEEIKDNLDRYSTAEFKMNGKWYEIIETYENTYKIYCDEIDSTIEVDKDKIDDTLRNLDKAFDPNIEDVTIKEESLEESKQEQCEEPCEEDATGVRKIRKRLNPDGHKVSVVESVLGREGDRIEFEGKVILSLPEIHHIVIETPEKDRISVYTSANVSEGDEVTGKGILVATFDTNGVTETYVTGTIIEKKDEKWKMSRGDSAQEFEREEKIIEQSN